jgi:hypothetical protein
MDSARDLAAWTDLARRELVDLVAIPSFSDEEHEAVDHLVAMCRARAPAAGNRWRARPTTCSSGAMRPERC